MKDRSEDYSADDADEDPALYDPDVPEDIPREAPVCPTEAEWSAMSEKERQQAVTDLEDSWTWEEEAERMAMAEGDAHLDAKIEIRDTLRAYFESMRRRIYIGSEIKTFYPGTKGFTPDLIAVTEVDTHRRTSWMVLKEGKGPDLAIEVYYSGRRKKDFVTNVEKFARLNIPEYFIFDRKKKVLLGYRLPPTAEVPRRYEPIQPCDARHHSEVLGLDLAVMGEQLRFFQGTSMLLTDRERAKQESARADQERDRANLAEQERQEEREQAEQERRQAEQERRQAEQERRQAVAEMCTRQARAILTVLRARGLPADDQTRGRIQQCMEIDLLERWMNRAVTAPAAEDIFLDG